MAMIHKLMISIRSGGEGGGENGDAKHIKKNDVF